MALIDASSEISLALDNDVFTHWRNGQQYVLHEVKGYFGRHKKMPSLTSITIFESIYGIERELANKKLSDEEARKYKQRINDLCSVCGVLPFDQTAALIAAHIAANIGKSNYNGKWRDILIAATALAHGHGVATQNRKDFELIANHLPPSHPYLSVAVWKP
jgi:predicted nucleic acid-binding protein